MMKLPFTRERLRWTAAWPLILLLLVACDSIGLYVYLGRRFFLLNPVWIYLTAYTLQYAFYLYASARLVPSIPTRYGKAAFGIILAGSLLFRAALISSPPSISTDIYRYVWDGRLINHGINPYRWAPNAECLRYLRDSIWLVMEYKAYQTIYMPVSQGVFAVANFLFGNLLVGYKIIYALFDMATIGLIVKLLDRFGQPRWKVIWYAWCPLPITEICIAGHQDIVGVFLLTLTVLLATGKRRPELTAVALVAAGFTKGFALVLLPLFARKLGRRFVFAAFWALIVIGMPMWVYLPKFLYGMRQYLQTVHVNSSIFYWLDQVFAPITSFHFEFVNKIADAIILTAIFWSVRKPVQDNLDLLRRALIVISVTLLVVPTLFPWYLLWVLPFAMLLGRRPLWAFIYLGLAVNLAYSFYVSMRLYWWMPLVEYSPFYAILLWQYVAWRLGCSPLEKLGMVGERRISGSAEEISMTLPQDPAPVTPAADA